MARLKFEDGSIEHNLTAIQAALSPVAVQVRAWPTGDDQGVQSLLAKDALTDSEKESVLQGLDHYFEDLKREAGYHSRDLIVLHDAIPNLDQALAKFKPAHTHDDDEVRYIVDGEGVFGFTMPDGAQVELLLEKGEYINVPKDTEHWFHLTEAMRIKAVRYFSGTDGWVPRYTGAEIRVEPMV